MCGTLLEQGLGTDPTSAEGRRIAELVRTCNEVSSVQHDRDVPVFWQSQSAMLRHGLPGQVRSGQASWPPYILTKRPFCVTRKSILALNAFKSISRGA